MGLSNSAQRAVIRTAPRPMAGRSVALCIECYPLSVPWVKTLSFEYDITKDEYENAEMFSEKITTPLSVFVEGGIRENVVVVEILFQDDYMPTEQFDLFISELKHWARFDYADMLGVLTLKFIGRLDPDVVPENRRLYIYKNIGLIAKHFASRHVTSEERERVLLDKVFKDERGLVFEDSETRLIKIALDSIKLNLWD
jgi:hypothetical protein